jgi:hypothetical protein
MGGWRTIFAEVDDGELRTCPSIRRLISLVEVTYDWLTDRPFLAPSDIAMSTDSRLPTSSPLLTFYQASTDLAETRVESEKVIVRDASPTSFILP